MGLELLAKDSQPNTAEVTESPTNCRGVPLSLGPVTLCALFTQHKPISTKTSSSSQSAFTF